MHGDCWINITEICFLNMKRRHVFLLTIGLLALVYFWKSKNRIVAIDTSKTASAKRARSLKLIEEQIRLEKEEANSSVSLTSIASFAATAATSKVLEKSC